LLGLGGISNQWVDLFVLWGLISLFGILGNAVGYWTGERLGRRCSTGGIAFYLRNVIYTRQKNFMISMVALQL
jgi:membrane-associated protein